MKKRVISFIFSFIVCLFVFGKVPVYVADAYSLGDNTGNFSHYLTEWTIEDVIAEPATQVTVNTDVIECSYCGYKFVK